MGLFSIFDPSNGLLSYWSISLVFPLMALSVGRLFLGFSRWFSFIETIITGAKKEISNVFMNKKEALTGLIMSIIVFIVLSNFFGIFPYVFTSTSHLMVSLSLSGPIWLLGCMIFLLKNIWVFLSHLTPLSTPYLLMPFMVCIEVVSLIIRPITLSVRLAANMIAGHLLLTLLGNLIFTQNKLFLGSLFITDFFLMSLEIAVALIQAYVFSVLSSLYINDSF